MPRPLRAVLLGALLLAEHAPLLPAFTVVHEHGLHGGSDPHLRRATLEARRYLYELSGEAPLLSDAGGGALLGAEPRVLVANANRLAHIHTQLAAGTAAPPREGGSHFVQLVRLEGNGSARTPVVVCSGVDSTATLYAVYSLLELLGVRFRNHGDVIPRDGHGRGLGELLRRVIELVPTAREWQTPNMVLRGSQPFFDFPAGPDWWGVDEYKHFMEQIAKQKMNFIGLHTYHNEPTVWQDSANVASFDPVSGNITHVATYPGTQYTYTTTLGGWGNTKQGAGWSGNPMNTSDYVFGSAQMYHEDCYATPAVMGDPEICPNPTSEEAQARIFNNVAAMLRDAFTYARSHLGLKTAVGTEAPRNSFYQASMSGAADQSATYDAVFKRVQAAYPIDLWWTWTPEGYIWQDGSSSPVGEMAGAPVVASSCPFDKDTSRYGGVAGQWQNSWLMQPSNSTGDSGTAVQSGKQFSLELAHPSPLQSGHWCLRPCAGASCAIGDLPAAGLCTGTKQEQWLYNDGSGQLSTASDTSLCMEAASCTHDPSGGTWWCQAPTVSLQKCRDGYQGQQWDWYASKPGDASPEDQVSATDFRMATKQAGYISRGHVSLDGHLSAAWSGLRSGKVDPVMCNPSARPVEICPPSATHEAHPCPDCGKPVCPCSAPPPPPPPLPPPSPPSPPAPSPPSPSPSPPPGTPITVGKCDSANPSPTRWTVDTATMYTTPITRVALESTDICLNCPDVGSPCHTWGCELDLTKISKTDCDRNGLFFAATQKDDTVQIQTYTDTDLCPVGSGQAGPGYCITATTRRTGSQIMLEKCDPALRDQQNFQLAVNMTSVVQLPRDNSAQPPLPALCLDIGSVSPAPGPPTPPGPPQPDTAGMFRVKGPLPWGNMGCLAVAPTPPCNVSWGQDGYHQKQCAMNDFTSMVASHNRLKPNFSLAVSGWTLGPGPETFPPGDAGWLNDKLPPEVAVGAMNIECGHAPPDPGLARLGSHSTFTIPWMEDDGGQNIVQLWVNRTLEWARQATSYNSTGGLFAEHWRTRAISLQFAALAQYPWNPGLTSRAFYTDFCKSDFGLSPADAAACAALWDDGLLDPTCKRLTMPACQSPTRPPMQGLPAAIKADSSTWDSQKQKYAFVDKIWSALDGKIHGAENRERWMYWMSMLRSLQADAEYATMWGEFDAIMEKVASEKDPAKQKQMAAQQALPLRQKMVAQAELAMQWKMNTTTTTGGLGATSNYQQYVISNSLAVRDCTAQAVSQGCFNHTSLLRQYTGAELPAAAMPGQFFTGIERCFVLSPRGSVEKGKLLTVRLIALLRKQNAGSAKAVLHYRPMGQGGPFAQQQMAESRRGSSVFSTTLPAVADLEYYATVAELVWPPGAPTIPHTVIVV